MAISSGDSVGCSDPAGCGARIGCGDPLRCVDPMGCSVPLSGGSPVGCDDPMGYSCQPSDRSAQGCPLANNPRHRRACGQGAWRQLALARRIETCSACCLSSSKAKPYGPERMRSPTDATRSESVKEKIKSLGLAGRRPRAGGPTLLRNSTATLRCACLGACWRPALVGRSRAREPGHNGPEVRRGVGAPEDPAGLGLKARTWTREGAVVAEPISDGSAGPSRHRRTLLPRRRTLPGRRASATKRIRRKSATGARRAAGRSAASSLPVSAAVQLRAPSAILGPLAHRWRAAPQDAARSDVAQTPLGRHLGAALRTKRPTDTGRGEPLASPEVVDKALQQGPPGPDAGSAVRADGPDAAQASGRVDDRHQLRAVGRALDGALANDRTPARSVTEGRGPPNPAQLLVVLGGGAAISAHRGWARLRAKQMHNTRLGSTASLGRRPLQANARAEPSRLPGSRARREAMQAVWRAVKTASMSSTTH